MQIFSSLISFFEKNPIRQVMSCQRQTWRVWLRYSTKKDNVLQVIISMVKRQALLCGKDLFEISLIVFVCKKRFPIFDV